MWQLAAAEAWSKATQLERVLIRGSKEAKQLTLVDALIRKTSAAGLGAGSAAGAGAAAGPGPGSTAADASAPGPGSADGAEANRSEPRFNERATAMMKQLFATRQQLPAPGQVLDFTEATPKLLLDPWFRSRIYIRKCYPDLFKLLENPNRKSFIITGTPGVGKSCFFYYLLTRLLALEEPPPYIVWEHWSAINKRWCYTHATQEVHCGNQESFDDELQNDNAWYIADGMPPANLTVPAHIVCITSPQRDTYRAMHKTAAKSLYMPRWELEELLACRTQVYDSSVPRDLAIKLFTCYGGVARYVLGLPALEAAGNPAMAADVEYHLQHLKQALHGSSVAQVGRLLGELVRAAQQYVD
ncbi:hypothetical protein HYH02_004031 [Chlamydomonas schloesseri]|uniref:Uncharacterized protein n=1 Tax=Chlamydomonas schloesseri TaxID=2026947 RepID=A0A836B945_9CHLO|nr:hypothetical protein HYH02_004031 [Chlamydomonas schloesseri]|eukprot:KAG2451432.1 hypothetical protein HYH02_004031 [Chlamydomonas schloesseri]